MSSFDSRELERQLMDFPVRSYQPATIEIEMSDQIFYKAYKCHSLTIAVTKYYTVAKIIASLALIYLNRNVQSYQQFNLWLSSLLAISFVQFIYRLYIGIIMQDLNTFIQTARRAEHLRIYPYSSLPQNNIQAHVHETYDFDQQLNLAANEQKIRSIINTIDEWIKLRYQLQWKNIYLIASYQIVQVFGFMLYVDFDTTTLQGKFLVTILFLGIYQYLQIYLILVAVIIIVPIFIIVRLITKVYQKYKKYKLLKILQQKVYSQETLLQEEFCPICMVPYAYGDKIVILPCNKSHNFHGECIKDWIKLCQNSPNCPMCRKAIA